MSDADAGTQAHQPLRGTTRRRLLQGTAALAGVTAASGAFTGFPAIWAQNIKDVVLRQAGSPVAAIPKIAEQANKDLGFTISMQATENANLLNRFLSQSSAIDVGDVSIVFMKYLVGRDVLQAIPLSKYKYWDRTIPLFTKGTYPDGAEASIQGVAPRPRRAEIRKGADRVADRHSDDHQCGHARHPSGSDRAPDPDFRAPSSRARAIIRESRRMRRIPHPGGVGSLARRQTGSHRHHRPLRQIDGKAGRTRDGGAFGDRMGNIAVWNTVMAEDRYLTRRWN